MHAAPTLAFSSSGPRPSICEEGSSPHRRQSASIPNTKSSLPEVNTRPNTNRLAKPGSLHTSHGVNSSNGSNLPKIPGQSITWSEQSPGKYAYQSSTVAKPKSRNPDFDAIITIHDYGLGRYAQQQVEKYPLTGSQPIPTGSSRQQPRANSPVEDRLSSFNGPASTANGASDERVNRNSHTISLAESVHKRLWKYRKLTKYGDRDECFVTHEDVFTHVNKSTIEKVLAETFTGEDNDDRLRQICGGKHALSRRMILAILIMIRKVESIKDFIKAGIYDSHLPLDRGQLKGNPFPKTEGNGHSKTAARNHFAEWEPKEIDDFYNTQYYVLTPFFHISNEEVHFYKMGSSKIRLPFAEWDEKGEGGHGKVYQVKIHSSHHNFVPSSNSGGEPVFAVKSVFTKSYKQFAREVRVLQHFSGSSTGHIHLIRLLMAFTHGDNYFLLFPWASGNLIDLWKRDPLPIRSLAKVRWLIDQCSGLAAGLAKLHNNNSWRYYHDGKLSQLGRHGDIKPHNILWFDSFDEPGRVHEDHLVVSDFGLSIFHSSAANTELTTANNVGRSPTYRPPEVDLGNGKVQQKYDIWSLGCLYLEFISWFLLGYEETRGNGPNSFSEHRIKKDNAHEDKFFIILNGGPDGGSYKAVVKQEVKAWIWKLRETKDCPQSLLDFLDVIRNLMLLPVAHDRAPMRWVDTLLASIKEQCHTSPEYCQGPGNSVLNLAANNREETPATGSLRQSAIANANLEMMNSELAVTSGSHEELDDIILDQLGEDLDDVILDKLQDCELGANDDREEPATGDSETRDLPTIIAPEPARDEFVLNQPPRRALTPDELPSLKTDITTTSETYQPSTPGDSAIVVVTPYAETSPEKHTIRPAASTICGSRASMDRSFMSERPSADTRRTSVSEAMPSQEEPAHETVLASKEPSTVTPDPAQPVAQTGRKTKRRRRRDNYRKKAIKILRPIWNRFKQLVEDVLLDDKSLASRRSTMKSKDSAPLDQPCLRR
ncbi:kinase-like domain-containing protein [Apiospora marii]|uniref:Kinase-like domain-containing protein n=1 Tax=Apiospora marii TaxID=335849 RepID=A0ABR1RAI6_9PEZI